MLKMEMNSSISESSLKLEVEVDATEMDKATLTVADHSKTESGYLVLKYEGKEDLQKLESLLRSFADIIKTTLGHAEV